MTNGNEKKRITMAGKKPAGHQSDATMQSVLLLM
jgi:hypothetical protein